MGTVISRIDLWLCNWLLLRQDLGWFSILEICNHWEDETFPAFPLKDQWYIRHWLVALSFKGTTLHRPSSLLDNQSTIAMIFFPMLRPRWLKMRIWCCHTRSGEVYCKAQKHTLLSSFRYICSNTQPHTTPWIWRIITRRCGRIVPSFPWTNCSKFPLPGSFLMGRSSSTDWGLCIRWCGRSLLCLASAWGEHAGASSTQNQLKRQTVGRYQGCFWIIGGSVTCLCFVFYVCI